MWVRMNPFVFVWSERELLFVCRCPHCGRADVRVRWPELFDFCDRCGNAVFAGPPSPAAPPAGQPALDES